jgi:exo-1,4-beta-D-glucosaminidase
VQYAYDDGSVVVVNSTLQEHRGLKVSARVLDIESKELLRRTAPLHLGPDASAKVFAIPEPPGAAPTYFVDLELRDSGGRAVSRNLYWLSTKKDVLAWDKSEWYVTPAAEYADLTGLQRLPSAEVKATARFASGRATVTLENTSTSLAFLVHLAVRKGPGGEEVLPVLWEDNYVTLLAGETRALAATYAPKDLGSAIPVVTLEGWNIPPATAR